MQVLPEKVDDNAKAWNNIAVLLIQQGREEEARIYLQRAILTGDATAEHNLKELQRVSK